MSLWSHDFESKTSTVRLIRAVRPMIHVTVFVSLISVFTERAIRKERENPGSSSRDPIFRNFLKFAFATEPHFFKYLDLIPVYEQNQEPKQV